MDDRCGLFLPGLQVYLIKLQLCDASDIAAIRKKFDEVDVSGDGLICPIELVIEQELCHVELKRDGNIGFLEFYRMLRGITEKYAGLLRQAQGACMYVPDTGFRACTLGVFILLTQCEYRSFGLQNMLSSRNTSATAHGSSSCSTSLIMVRPRPSVTYTARWCVLVWHGW